MIEAVVGLIGGGKSCLAIYRCLKYISEGGRVYMNMRLVGAVEVYDIDTQKMSLVLSPDAPICRILRKRYKWEYQQGQYNFLVPDDMENGFQGVIPPGTPEKKVLVVLDEVNEWFDSLDRSRVNTDKTYRSTLRFLRQSRKVYIDCIFILQVFTTLDSRIRELVGFVWVCRDMQYFEVAGLSVGWLLKRFFVWQKFYKDMKVPVAKPKWVAKDLQIFGCYDTTELFGDGLGILPAGCVKTDFSGAGKIVKKKGQKMNKLQSALLVVCCLSSALCTVLMLRAGSVTVPAGVPQIITVTNTVGAVGVDRAPVPSGSVEWGRISYVCAGKEDWAYVNGRMYKPGFRTDRGVVVSVDRYAVRCVGEDGRDNWIFHSEGSGSSVAPVGGAVELAKKGKGVKGE